MRSREPRTSLARGIEAGPTAQGRAFGLAASVPRLAFGSFLPGRSAGGGLVLQGHPRPSEGHGPVDSSSYGPSLTLSSSVVIVAYHTVARRARGAESTVPTDDGG